MNNNIPYEESLKKKFTDKLWAISILQKPLSTGESQTPDITDVKQSFVKLMALIATLKEEIENSVESYSTSMFMTFYKTSLAPLIPILSAIIVILTKEALSDPEKVAYLNSFFDDVKSKLQIAIATYPDKF